MIKMKIDQSLMSYLKKNLINKKKNQPIGSRARVRKNPTYNRIRYSAI